MKCNGGGNGASGSSKSISESESESSEKMRDEDVDEAPVLSLASSYYIYNSVNSVIVCMVRKMSNICLTLYLLG